MTLRTTQELWKIAWFDRTIRARVALELLASWPIPVGVTEQIQFRFFYYASFGPPPAKQFKLYPPCWEAWIAADGTVEKLHRIQPREAGLGAEQGQPFAAHSWPTDWTLEAADQKRVDLLAAYDRVIPLWLAREPTRAAAEARVVTDCRQRFLELTEPPLVPCYQALGRDFFDWIGIPGHLPSDPP